jgi:hypothetical protein
VNPSDPESRSEGRYSPDALASIVGWVRAYKDAWEFSGERGIHLRRLFARATGTCIAASSLSAAEYGVQAVMLCRPLFEDLVLACWIKWIAHPNLVTSRLRDQERYVDLIWNELADKYPSLPRRTIRYQPTAAERDRYIALFGQFAQIPWWETRDIVLRKQPTDKGRFKAIGKPRNLSAIIDELAERSVPYSPNVAVPGSGPSEKLVGRLEYLRDVINRTNNEMLHYTAVGSGLSYDARTRKWRDGPTSAVVQLALSSLLITYDKLVFVMLEHNGREHLMIDYLALRTRLGI